MLGGLWAPVIEVEDLTALNLKANTGAPPPTAGDRMHAGRNDAGLMNGMLPALPIHHNRAACAAVIVVHYKVRSSVARAPSPAAEFVSCARQRESD